jgi:putative ABC transport system permease protein
VTQRRREIGIRVALGSTPSGIVKLVIREGLLLVGMGFAIGFLGAAALQRTLESQLYGVRPLDPLVIAIVVALLAVMALAACVLPALRAIRVDPVSVLHE